MGDEEGTLRLWKLSLKAVGGLAVLSLATGLGCGAAREPGGDEASDPPSQLWTGGAFPCSDRVAEIQVTEITSGPSDDQRYAGQTALRMELVDDKERIQAICGAIGRRMSRSEVLCPPELLEAYQAELRAKGGQVIATAVRATRFVDSTGKERAQDLSLWLTLTPRPLCYELSPADPAALDKLLRAALP